MKTQLTEMLQEWSFCNYEVYFPTSDEHKGFLTSKGFHTKWKKVMP